MPIIFETCTAFEPFTKIENFIAGRLDRDERLLQIVSTVEEQALLRRLLFRNHTRLSSEYSPALKEDEKGFKTSFLLPLSTLGQAQIGKLMQDLGCTVCGDATTTRCSGCLSERYCSAGTSRLTHAL